MAKDTKGLRDRKRRDGGEIKEGRRLAKEGEMERKKRKKKHRGR